LSSKIVDSRLGRRSTELPDTKVPQKIEVEVGDRRLISKTESSCTWLITLRLIRFCASITCVCFLVTAVGVNIDIRLMKCLSVGS